MFPEELVITKHQEEKVFEMEKDYPYVIRQCHSRPGLALIAPWHWHQEFELIYVHQGAVTYQTMAGTLQVEKGNGLFVNGNVLHQVSSSRPVSETHYEVHMFLKDFLAPEGSRIEKEYLHPLLLSRKLSVAFLDKNVPAQQDILDKLHKLSALNSQKSFGYEILSRNLLGELVLFLLNQETFSDHREHLPAIVKESRLKEMLLFIQEHYSDSLSLGEIAASVNISERECLRCFQKEIHTTPFTYLQEYRIQMACGLLKNTADTVTAVASKCGFNSGSYFGKVFRRQMNCTPYEYRRLLAEEESSSHAF